MFTSIEENDPWQVFIIAELLSNENSQKYAFLEFKHGKGIFKKFKNMSRQS
jgi:hypothetical protein